MKITLYVTSISKSDGGILILATNGGPEGPPLLQVKVPYTQHHKFRINQPIEVDIQVLQA